MYRSWVLADDKDYICLQDHISYIPYLSLKKRTLSILDDFHGRVSMDRVGHNMYGSGNQGRNRQRQADHLPE